MKKTIEALETIRKSLSAFMQNDKNKQTTYTPGPNGSMINVLRVHSCEFSETKLTLRPNGTVEEAVFILDSDESPAHSPS